MKPSSRSVLLVSLVLAAAPVGATISVSPGSPDEAVELAGGCPTFSWASAPGARGYELVVYRLDDEGAPSPEPALEQRLPTGATSWTPARCLAAGERYAWSLRALGARQESRWSEARLFRVAGRPSLAEVEQALAVLRRYLESAETSASEQATRVASPPPGRTARGTDAASAVGGGPSPGGAPAGAALPRQLRSESAPARRPRMPLPSTEKGAGGASTDSAVAPVIPTTAPTLSTAPSLTIDNQLHLGGASAMFWENSPFLWSNDNHNLALGPEALSAVTALGSNNTAVGPFALRSFQAGSFNVAVGDNALSRLEEANWNTAVGDVALVQARSGFHNTALGATAGSELEGNAPPGSPSSFSWNIFIGNPGEKEDEYTIRLGRPFGASMGHRQTFIAGDIAIGSEDPPTNQLVVVDSLSGDGNEIASHVARIQNSHAGSSPDVLALEVGATDPGGGVNFIGFFDGNGLVGEIEGDGEGGVHFKGSRVSGVELSLSPTDTPPTCNASRRGSLYFDLSINRPCYCEGSSWRSVVDTVLCS